MCKTQGLAVALIALLCVNLAAGATLTLHTSLLDTLCRTLGCDIVGSIGLWLGGATPQAGDDLIINATYAFSLGSALTVNSISLASGATFTVKSGASLTLTSALDVASSAALTVAGTLTASGNAVVGGMFDINSGATATFKNGLAVNNTAAMTVSGTLALAAGYSSIDAYTLDFGSNSMLSVGSAGSKADADINTATTIAGTLSVANAASVAFNAATTLSGTVNLATGSVMEVNAATTVSNALRTWGDVEVYTGAVLQMGTNTYTQVAGMLNLQGGTVTGTVVNITSAANLTGNGIITADVAVDGWVNVGNSPGTVTINGDYTMNWDSTFEMEAESTTSFDKLIIRGTFHRNGILYAHFINGYTPKDGDSFLAFAHSGATGSFNVLHGNYFDLTFGRVSANYDTLTTTIKYSAAAPVVLSLGLIVCCILAVLLL